MALLGVDLGGTKLALAVISEAGQVLRKERVLLGERKGPEVGSLIVSQITGMIDGAVSAGTEITAIGVSVPGISHSRSGTVWAPNIPGWEDYPLLDELQRSCGRLPVYIDSDRACYILGEQWQGNARGCRNAVYLSVGTGIGAGILVDGAVLRGAHDAAGAIGWLALDRPFDQKYESCGCFEHFASGVGIARMAGELVRSMPDYQGRLRGMEPDKITARDVFEDREDGGRIGINVLQQCIEYWGMAVANLVSLFNPEKIIFGGGVFGPSLPLIPAIKEEASRWAQPVSIEQVSLEPSGLGGDAGMYGAGYLALTRRSSARS